MDELVGQELNLQDIVVALLQHQDVGRRLDLVYIVERDDQLHRVEVPPKTLHRALAEKCEE